MEAGGGSERAFGSARIGTQLGDNAWGRFYGKWYERDTGGASTQGGLSGFDDSRMKQGGFRLDWTPDSDTRFTVQGDIYTGASGDVEMVTGPPPEILDEEIHDIFPRGGNVIARLSQTTAEDAGWDLQFYFDHIERIELSEPQTTRRNVFDIDFQSHSQPLEGHNVVWGAGYRLHHDRLDTSPAFYWSYDDGNRRYDIFSTFLQDEIALIEDTLKLTLGSKLSHNDFTGWEIQPSSVCCGCRQRLRRSGERFRKLCGLRRGSKTMAVCLSLHFQLVRRQRRQPTSCKSAIPSCSRKT